MSMLPPSGGYPTEQAPLRGARPREVEISFWLWITTFVLGVLGAIAASSQISQIRATTIDQELARNPAADRSTIEHAFTIGFAVAIGIGLLIVVAELIFVFLMRGGRNWARITLAVLGGLGVLIGLAAGTGSVIGVLQLLLLIGAIVTMFLPAANAWFRPRRPGF